jgi:phosphate transport system substrate-binding protein
MQNRVSKWVLGAAALVTLVSIVGCGAANTTNQAANGTSGATTQGGASTIQETGSSLLYPLFNGQWVSAYKSVDPNVNIIAASTGSGAGISQAIAGQVQIGASDAYMADAQMAGNPSMVNIPLAISAQQVMYNVPGIPASEHLKLSGDVLAQIYMGKITKWNDAQIKALNPGVTLPSNPIVVVRRSDGSGDTFLFTQFLTDTSSAWKNGPAFGTSVSWPTVSGEIGAKGNEGVVQTMTANKYSIGYVGISWLDKASSQGLGYAALQNQAKKFVLPTNQTIQAAANASISKIPDDERVSLIYASGDNSYPIVNFEYAIVNTKQPSADMANNLKKFLNFAVDPAKGNSSQYLKPVHFLPLPSSIEPKSVAQINKISG